MAHFAKVEDGVVVSVLVVPDEHEDDAEQWLNSIGMHGRWIQTSYNTYGGQHPEGRPLRKNYAGIGYVYDEDRDAFYEPQTFPSWHLNEDTCLWEPPYPPPNEFCYWDEESQQWVDPRIP